MTRDYNRLPRPHPRVFVVRDTHAGHIRAVYPTREDAIRFVERELGCYIAEGVDPPCAVSVHLVPPERPTPTDFMWVAR